MKTIYTTIIIVLIAAVPCFAQRFKVTGFKGSDNRFTELESRIMGKIAVIVVYDTSISLKIDDDKSDIIHYDSDNTYVLDMSKSDTKETQKLTVKLNKTLGYINSITVSFNIAENAGKYRTASWTFTAKRE